MACGKQKSSSKKENPFFPPLSTPKVRSTRVQIEADRSANDEWKLAVYNSAGCYAIDVTNGVQIICSSGSGPTDRPTESPFLNSVKILSMYVASRALGMNIERQWTVYARRSYRTCYSSGSIIFFSTVQTARCSRKKKVSSSDHFSSIYQCPMHSLALNPDQLLQNKFSILMLCMWREYHQALDSIQLLITQRAETCQAICCEINQTFVQSQFMWWKSLPADLTFHESK